MNELNEKINRAVKLHGHLCAGTVIGVRLALLGLKKIGISDPTGRERKDFIVYVESTNCLFDALQVITGCRITSHSLKLFDYGKSAACFYNLKTGKAIRVICPESTRDLVNEYAPKGVEDKKQREVEAYKVMPDEKLFVCTEVKIALKDNELPGVKTKRIPCPQCREVFNENQGIIKEGNLFCRACAEGKYYQ